MKQIAIIFFSNLIGIISALADTTHIYIDTSTEEIPIYSHAPNSLGNNLYMVISQPLSHVSVTKRSQKPLARKPNLSILSLIHVAAVTYGVPASLILAVIQVESNFKTNAISSAGAVGLMQVMPQTAKDYGLYDDLENPQKNIDVGTRYLRDLLLMFDGDVKLALAAYNAGPGAVRKYGMQIPPFKETRTYVPEVLKFYDQYALAEQSDF